MKQKFIDSVGNEILEGDRSFFATPDMFKNSVVVGSGKFIQGRILKRNKKLRD